MALIKLKIILQSKSIILVTIFLTTLMVIIKINKVNYQEIGNQKVITGIITSISKNEYNSVLEINNVIINTKLEHSFILGQKVKCIGVITLPNTNTNFHLFNYRNYLLSKGIYYQMNDSICNIIIGNVSISYKIKNFITNRINNFKSKEYLKAFIIGDATGIDDKVLTSYRSNGISHLFAISGMHITFIVGILSFMKKKYFLVIFLLFYLFLANFPISMIRAVIFFILMKININIKLNMSTIVLFFYFTVFLIWINPYYIYNTGFIYSFIISFYLILFSELLNSRKYLNIFLIPIIVFIITIPINIQTNFYLNFLTPLLNIIFIPIVSTVLFPMSFIVFLFPFLDSGYYFLWILIENFSIFIANTIYINMIFCNINFYAFIGYYAIITFTMHKISKNEYKYISILFITLFIHSNYIYIRNYGIIQMLDVGQGDSIIISYPNNKLNILIDTGGNIFRDTNKSTITEPIIIPSLYSLGIKKLDYLILTHGDFDHVGETIYLLNKFKVKNVLFNEGKINKIENEIIEYLIINKINYSFISEKTISYNGIDLMFLNSKNLFDENEDSLVLFSSIKNYSYLFMGDSSIETENKILLEYKLNNVDILKVGHHGSKSSSSKNFIENIKPTVALISVGKNNLYRHPHKEVLENLQFCDTYMTSIHGAVRIKIDNRMLVNKVR